MRTILIFNFLGNLLVAISYLLISGFSGAAICFVACFQVVVNYGFDVKGKKVPTYWIIIHTILFLAVNILTFGNWYDVFSLVAAMLFVLSVAQNDAKYYRILYVSNSMLWIFYDFLAKAYGNLFTHIVLFIATTFAIFLRDVKKTTK